MRVKVYGKAYVYISVDVELPDDTPKDEIEERAIEKAWDEFSSLEEFCGNGGYDKLVGTSSENV